MRSLSIVVASIFVLSQAIPFVEAQESVSPNGDANRPRDVQDFEAQIDKLDVADEVKTQLKSLVSQTVSRRAESAELELSAKDDLAAADAVAEKKEKLQAELKTLREAPSWLDKSGSLPEMVTRLDQLKLDRDAAVKNRDLAGEALAASATRKSEIEKQLPELNATLAERKRELDALPNDAEADLQETIRLNELKSSVQWLQAKIAALSAEQKRLVAQAGASIPQLSADIASQKAERLLKQFELLSAEVEKRRTQETADRVMEAKAQGNQLPEVLKPIADRNQELADKRQALAPLIAAAEKDLSARKASLGRIRENLKKARDRIEKIGLTDAVGAMLRNLKAQLPNTSAYRLDIFERSSTISDANFALLEMLDERNRRVSIVVDRLLLQQSPTDSSKLREQAAELLTQQRDKFLDPAIADQTAYFNALSSISATEQEIVQAASEFEEYINENVLWIRSSQPMYLSPVPSKSELEILKRRSWQNVGGKIWADFTQSPVLWIGVFVLVAYLIRARVALRRAITDIGDRAIQANAVHFMPTIRALLLTIGAAIPIPLLAWFLSSRFAGIAGNEPALQGLSESLFCLAATCAPIEFARQTCRPGGLAESHFQWPQSSMRKLASSLRWLLAFGVPVAMVAAFFGGVSTSYGNDVLQRYFSIAATIIVAIFVYRVTHPRNGVMAGFLASRSDGWLNRLAKVWHPVLIAIPIVMLVLNFMGYFFTASQLSWRLLFSICLFFAASVVTAMVTRWSLIHRRKIRLAQLKAKREALESDESDTHDDSIQQSSEEETPEELQEHMEQSRKLARTMMAAGIVVGLWFVWSDVVPALSFFEKWPVWTSTQMVSDTIVDDTGKSVSTSRQVSDPVTIAELFLAGLILILGFAAARNVPGMLEFAVLTRLPLNRSVRYAITTLVSYAIVLIGLIAAGGTIGLHWNQVQWMATALTFGLAFGLQEMFANFVAGIIMLFEQPVRVGDVVEVDGVTGVVTKINIRATTITNWDRIDYIVPNKEFITGKLFNWTRTDDVIRLVLKLGVAYGSDTELARKLLLETVHQHPDILQTPPPSVWFDEFGDSSLNFTVRAMVKTYQKKLEVEHELHMTIDQKFRDAEIEISFPQRDLHIRAIPDQLLQNGMPTTKPVEDAFGSSKSNGA